jgi:hypothetical protein
MIFFIDVVQEAHDHGQLVPKFCKEAARTLYIQSPSRVVAPPQTQPAPRERARIPTQWHDTVAASQLPHTD